MGIGKRPMSSSRGRRLSGLLGLLILGAAAAAFYLVVSGHWATGMPVCSACGRPLHPAEVFVLAAKGGKPLNTCCPRCGLRSAAETGAMPWLATDFSNGQRIDAASALYLEGSDLMQCCDTPALHTEGGAICDLHFDRCLPSLVAFARSEDAERYRRQHGGRIIDFAAARQSVLRQMGQTSPVESK